MSRCAKDVPADEYHVGPRVGTFLSGLLKPGWEEGGSIEEADGGGGEEEEGVGG